ncbi:hypothetical protein AZE42_03068 [Rhizopogon vesiculosus]|uniref:non-specific serine/threonine protein kinase n=1 Tax=Rhizopogon vesiculosus TaxID=180088 RepID=A0A1J8QCE1_9AGAM|nr:hypothetical protein AZE42_03068 [Rhizopogon vesiculosus]
MTFELLTGRSLFHPEAGETWRVEDDHLAKMAELTGDDFSDKVLAKSRKRDEYFDKTGKLLRIDQLFPMSLEQAMTNYGLQAVEAASAAAFIRACLHLDSEERSSASDLLTIHGWKWPISAVSLASQCPVEI